MKRLLAIALFSVVLAPVAASAQSYVAASISADVVRNTTVDDVRGPGTGEALSFSLRTGASVTPMFGVEVDFTRASEIETDETPDIRILADVTLLSLTGAPAIPASAILGYRLHTEQQTTTVTASAWARQDVTPRFAMVYLGGVAFARLERSVTTSFNYQPLLASLFRPTYQTRTVEYRPGPMVGLEGRIALTEHAQLIPGFRLLAIGDGWTMRPAVGLGWTF